MIRRVRLAGLVAELVRQKLNLSPSFLQGHCGDVNASDATQWMAPERNQYSSWLPGLPKQRQPSTAGSVDVCAQVNSFRPLDINLSPLAQEYRTIGEVHRRAWVNAGFAADWYQGSLKEI
jgi:hypothetical protein